jgi:branched-chain amino acid transport system permease protein
VLAGAVIYLLRATRLGAAIRAVGWSRQAVEIVGVNPRATLCIAAIVAGALCGFAGVLLGELTAISYTLGDNLLLAGFAAVVIGGVGDIRGAVVGGLLIGVVETLSALYISEAFQDAITFGLLLAFLLFRPRGLFGSREATRA